MARAIIRYSMDGDGGATHNDIRAHLEASGFVKIGTASFDAPDQPHVALLDALDGLVNILRQPRGRGRLDHLWVYLDEPDDAPAPFTLDPN